MRIFKIILVKELKSMVRDPKILIAMFIVPFIVVGIMYSLVIFSTRQMVEEAVRGRGVIALVDNDHGYWAVNLTKYLKNRGFKIFSVKNVDELVDSIRGEKVLCGLVIPRGFSENITLNRTAYVRVYIYIASPSISHLISKTKVLALLNSYSQNVSRTLIRIHGLNPKYVSNPINSTTWIILKDRVFNIADIGSLIGAFTIINIGLPLIAMMLSAFLVQLTATSIAVEKEEKMFETLLSLPINRFEFIAAKIAASVIIGLIGLSLYGALFMWYFSSLAGLSTPPTSSEAMGSFSVWSIVSSVYGLNGLAMFFTALGGLVLFLLGLSIILALFVEDVRSAQMITSYIVMPLLFVMLVSMFIDLAKIPTATRYVLAAIPFINIGCIPTYLFLGDRVAIYVSAFSSIAYAVVTMYVASRIITTEKAFTLKLFRRRRK